MHLHRDEFGFLIVFAFPNASNIGDAAIIRPALSIVGVAVSFDSILGPPAT